MLPLKAEKKKLNNSYIKDRQQKWEKPYKKKWCVYISH